MIASRSEQTPPPLPRSSVVFTWIVVARATAGTPVNASTTAAAAHLDLDPPVVIARS
jgi:hypothetical protein